MAYCPECKGEMLPTAIVCPHCGYDFPVDSHKGNPSRGFAYSPLADLALVAGMVAAIIAACGAVIASVVSIFHGQFVNGFVVYPIAFLVQLGVLVVFLRVQQ
jgi:hypothetical protein